MRKRAQQLEFQIPKHGGRRKNAGRKKTHATEPSHDSRPRINARTPVHITLKLRPGFGNLRSIRGIDIFSKAAEASREYGLNIIHFSLQSNHLHMICEAVDNETLTRGMRSITTRLAKNLQKLGARAGKVFAGRYHMTTLENPTKAKNAIRYVVFNHDHHCKQDLTIDEFSSGAACEFNDSPPRWLDKITRALSEPRSWLLRDGWMRSRY